MNSSTNLLQIITCFLFQPLTERIKIKEGGLILFNVALSIFSCKIWYMVLFHTGLAIFCMSALYGFNDYTDRVADLKNPKKNHRLAQKINQYPLLFLTINAFVSLVCIIFAALLTEGKQGIIALLLFGVNILYSLFFKSLPLADLIMVGIWGGLFVGVTGGAPVYLLLIVGFMTAIAHLFQTITDREPDVINGTHTTATKYNNPAIILLTYCLMLSALLFWHWGVFFALSAAIPFVCFVLFKNISVTWNISRAYFGSCWLILMYNVYGWG